MCFKQGDTVLYGMHGICTIIELTQQDFCGSLKDYYVLKPVYENKSTIFVPVDNPELTSKMRRILSAAEIRDIISAMPQEKNIWIDDDAHRKEAYTEILKKGDRRELVQLIKTLYIHQKELLEKGKKLHVADERLFKEAENLLYEEFAHVLKISRDQVLPLIQEQITVAEKKNA